MDNLLGAIFIKKSDFPSLKPSIVNSAPDRQDLLSPSPVHAGIFNWLDLVQVTKVAK